VEKIVFQIRNEEDINVIVFERIENIETLISKINNFEKYNSEFEKIKTEKRKLEFLNVRAGLNYLTRKEVVIKYDSNGKPFIDDNQLNISISHSGNFIALAVHPSKPVGIDVEKISEKIQRVCQRFLSADEQIELSNGDDIRKLIIVWSAKEALYKIIGFEAVDFAQQLRILPFETDNSGDIVAEFIPAKRKYKLNYFFIDDYVIVYCIE